MKISASQRHLCGIIFGDSTPAPEHCCEQRCCCVGRIYCRQLFGSPDLWEGHRTPEGEAEAQEGLKEPRWREEPQVPAEGDRLSSVVQKEDDLGRQREGQKRQEKLWTDEEENQTEEVDPLEEMALELERMREMYWEENGKPDLRETEQSPKGWQTEEKGTQTEEGEPEWAEEMDSEASGELGQQETEETPEDAWSKEKGTQTEEQDPVGLEEVEVEEAEEPRPREKWEESAGEEERLRAHGAHGGAGPGLRKLPTKPWFPGGSHCCDWLCSSLGWDLCLRTGLPAAVLALLPGAQAEGGHGSSGLREAARGPPPGDRPQPLQEAAQPKREGLRAEQRGTQTDQQDPLDQEVLVLEWVWKKSGGRNGERHHRGTLLSLNVRLEVSGPTGTASPRGGR
ncbi:uncharacterized protein LOC119936608 [Tachyglossus aculeatus]|uniref:uncharacterized protein LOC119936608 n=1 Tax=Tachyglossus aculeatus TaxID=9261 RepID=UPI0018F7A67B|nr:uncharacterized protein LOC119936608 [Tachyglossus aculeatus]